MILLKPLFRLLQHTVLVLYGHSIMSIPAVCCPHDLVREDVQLLDDRTYRLIVRSAGLGEDSEFLRDARAVPQALCGAIGNQWNLDLGLRF